MIQRENFEQLVAEGLNRIPKKFREKIKNVAILVKNEPTQTQLRENDIPKGDTLLGLYEGIPLTERGVDYGAMPILPDRIFIFQKPIEEEAEGDPEQTRQIVAETVWHEVAHYFGMNEEEVETREARE